MASGGACDLEVCYALVLCLLCLQATEQRDSN
jgi:hypothetical protein